MTNTTQDTELFELCKEVYKATGWEEQNIFNRATSRDPNVWGYPLAKDKYDAFTPLYTSDYLLENLPRHINKDSILYELIMRNPFAGDYRFHYWSDTKKERLLKDDLGMGFVAVGDTPLKALLKLTLALHETGELK